MPVVYAMLRILRESEYLRRPPGLKKFRGYPARGISPVGRIPHAVSPGARVMMKSPVSTNPNERYRATAAMFSRPTAERVLHIRSVRPNGKRSLVTEASGDALDHGARALKFHPETLKQAQRHP